MTSAENDLRNYFYFGAMMVRQGLADGMVAGVTVNYPEVLRPALKTIGIRSGGKRVAGMYVIQHQHQMYFLSDCAVNINPSAEELAEIAILTADQVQRMQFEPRIAMLSFSNFGSVRTPETEKVARAVAIINQLRPDLMVDGPIQADTALDMDMLHTHFPFSKLSKPNVLIFPNLDAANIAYKITERLAGAKATGPILQGLAKPYLDLSRGCTADDIITAACCVPALL